MQTTILTILNFQFKSTSLNGILLPVVYSEIKYFYPLKFDDLFIVKVGLEQIPRSKLILNYKIENNENKEVCLGNIHLAFLNSQNNKPTRAPEKFIFEFKKKYQL